MSTTTVPGRTFRALHSRYYRLFITAAFVGQTGTWVHTIAAAALVLDLSGGGLALGVMTAAQFLPVLLIGPWAGSLADRHRRLLIMRGCQTVSLVISAGVAVLVFNDMLSLPGLVGATAALGVVNAVEMPARLSIAPDLVEAGDVSNAIGLHSTVLTFSRVVGPIVAGLVVAGPGTATCFALNSLSFCVQIVLLARLRLPGDDERRRRIVSGAVPAAAATYRRRPVRDGLQAVWGDRQLRLSVLLVGIFGALSFAYNVVLPLLAERELDGGAGTYAALFAAMSVGSMGAGLVVARRQAVDLNFLLRSATGTAVSNFALAFAPNLFVAMLLVVPTGFYFVLVGSAFYATMYSRARPDQRGRAVALVPAVLNGMTPLGGVIVGTLSDAIGIRPTLASAAVASTAVIAAVAIAARRAPR